MAANTTMRRASGRSTKSTKGRMRVTRGSNGVVSQPARRPERRQNSPRLTAFDAELSLAERVEKERRQIFKALSIVECCWYATATKWAVDDQEYMIPAFEAACDLLNDVTEALETIASECEKLRPGGASLRARRPD